MFETLHKAYPDLYGKEYDEKEMDKRFGDLVSRHEKLFGKKDPAIFSAAGRT